MQFTMAVRNPRSADPTVGPNSSPPPLELFGRLSSDRGAKPFADFLAIGENAARFLHISRTCPLPLHDVFGYVFVRIRRAVATPTPSVCGLREDRVSRAFCALH